MVLSSSDFSLKLNDPAQPIMLTLVNNPTYQSVHSPVLATILDASLRLMSVRNHNPSLLLLDEGSTLKLPNLARIPATLRSYDIGTVWGLQDKVQANLMYDENTTKAVLSNLSVKILGKANDPDTMKFYERFFELIKVDQQSISRSDELFNASQRRITTSTQEKAKHRGQEFMRLQPGEFFVFDESGKSKKVQFKVPEHQFTKPQPVYNHSFQDLKQHFDQILKDCKSIGQ